MVTTPMMEAVRPKTMLVMVSGDKVVDEEEEGAAARAELGDIDMLKVEYTIRIYWDEERGRAYPRDQGKGREISTYLHMGDGGLRSTASLSRYWYIEWILRQRHPTTRPAPRSCHEGSQAPPLTDQPLHIAQHVVFQPLTLAFYWRHL